MEKHFLRIVCLAFLVCFCLHCSIGKAQDKPNIVWITTEDISPNLGCYGDPYAHWRNRPNESQPFFASNTIVFFYSDHGAGLPIYKRWLYDTGLKVPLIIKAPEQYTSLVPHAMGSRTDELVSFVDLTPILLGLAGLQVPGNMQGRAFPGQDLEPGKEFVLAGRDRMSDKKFVIPNKNKLL